MQIECAAVYGKRAATNTEGTVAAKLESSDAEGCSAEVGINTAQDLGAGAGFH